MSFYTDPAFFVVAAVLAVPSVLLGLMGRSRGQYGLFASVIMLVLLFGHDGRGALSLAVFLVLGFVLTRWVMWLFLHERMHRVGLFRLALALMVLPLVAVKASMVFEANFLGFIGASYITFKAIQVLIEIRDGLIKQMGVFDYLAFLLFFPVFVSGPITRSRDFLAQLHEHPDRQAYLALLAQGALWLLKGAVYTFVLASFFEWLMWFGPSAITGSNVANEAARQIVYGFCYGLYLFFDFAGYSFMAMGLGSCFGIRVPANFNAPFRSIDIKDFWNRWHITLSYWLRDFVFMRLMRSLMKHRVFPSRTTGACVAYLAEMTLMGMWHGLTVDYIVYGVYHGVLLAACELFQRTAFYKKHRKERWYRLTSWAITMVAVFFGFALFSGQVFDFILGVG